MPGSERGPVFVYLIQLSVELPDLKRCRYQHPGWRGVSVQSERRSDLACKRPSIARTAASASQAEDRAVLAKLVDWIRGRQLSAEALR